MCCISGVPQRPGELITPVITALGVFQASLGHPCYPEGSSGVREGTRLQEFPSLISPLARGSNPAPRVLLSRPGSGTLHPPVGDQQLSLVQTHHPRPVHPAWVSPRPTNPGRRVGFWQRDLPRPACRRCLVSHDFGVPAPRAVQRMPQQRTLHRGFLPGSRDGAGREAELAESQLLGWEAGNRHSGPCRKGGAGSAPAWGDKSCLPGCSGHGHAVLSWHPRAGPR